MISCRYFEPADEFPEHYMDRCLCGHCGTEEYQRNLSLLLEAQYVLMHCVLGARETGGGGGGGMQPTAPMGCGNEGREREAAKILEREFW